MRVFYVTHFGVDPPHYGESDGVIVDKDYIRVGDQLMNRAFVWPATPENVEIYESFRKQYKAWQASEPNAYAALHKMARQ